MGKLDEKYKEEVQIERLQKEILQQKVHLRAANDSLSKLQRQADDLLIENKSKDRCIEHLQSQLTEKAKTNRWPKITEEDSVSEFEIDLNDDMGEMYDMLVSKNKSYGNSALDPIRVFSNANPMEQILVRIDDKLSRIKRGTSYPGDNDVKDLIGYFFLFLQAERKMKQ